MRAFFKSSIGRKMVVAVTGLVLFIFVIFHMLGNLQIFLGADALNDYARHLDELPYLLWPARAVLLAALLLHVGFSLALANENRRARPVRYVHGDTVQASRASRTMVITGLVILFFIIYHLLHFTFGVTNPEFFHLTDAKGREDIYSMVVLSFQNGWIAGTYILAMFFLCLHLGHGVSSVPQSLGFSESSGLRKNFGRFGNLAGVLVFIGNSSIVLAVLLGKLK
ncbi:MAG: succinate dehydrogenase cytochrome b subunit [Candidatus Omnitrophica bacterium]|nr:succinate dehydrogenase cytochrome b subunit [Candidatus Omnitrophota bacterium]